MQAGPVYLDKAASLERALGYIERAAQAGAELIAFAETWFSGYPIWLDVCPGINIWDDPGAKATYAAMHRSSIEVPGPEADRLAQAARDFQIAIAMGANERIPTGPGNGTLYNAFLLWDAQGELRIHHRKLMPTHTERLVHGPGDAQGLHAVDMDGYRLGGLICWEHWMPLSRQALHDSGEHLHLALWPHVKELNHLASRHYAIEGRCYVLAVGARMQARELPSGLPLPNTFVDDPDQWMMKGGSALYGPDGQCVAGPAPVDQDLLLWEIPDFEACVRERMALDSSGHYQRPDVFDFTVQRRRKS